jgi:hypothetical protein
MGTTTTNLSLYKPTVGEVGWGEEVDANFDTLDQRAFGPDAILYVTDVGDDANDGKSWGTAKETIMAAYDVLPPQGGEIRVCATVPGGFVDCRTATARRPRYGSRDAR